MTIQLPADLENRVNSMVASGRFPSVDDAMAEAARLLIRELDRGRETRPPDDARAFGLGSIGAMRDAAEELDEIVADAYRHRCEETWRDITRTLGPPKSDR
jgi:Arc/MetJ-type ribon-helix-helix transcriptional regulator